MSGRLRGVSAPERIFRLGRRTDPWAWPDWSYAGEDGTFGNRWDDPRSEYRVLYASSQRLGPFLETLARFRPDPAIAAALIEADPRDAAFPTASAGRLPTSWLEKRSLGEANCGGDFADVGHADSLAHLRQEMASSVVRYGLPDLDGSAIRSTVPRRFTQDVSRHVYERTSGKGERAFQGVRYRSRLGDDVENWAIWEPAEISVMAVAPIDRADSDLSHALELLGIELS